ncbi:YihY/virulence factor BrkB family protein [Ottowia testudinis]|uniref:YihY/virulence factor BrkB family protein n=1 Tax=Ottowia testudinis TaxID=2816950 RepID=A0A975CG30_9BURK|nr:YihY/virulence factor BrkB family protein [Ottowia testudinis]
MPKLAAAESIVSETVLSGTTIAAPSVPKLLQGRFKPLHPLYRAFELWSDADGLRMSAAMSFYGILSLAPLLVLIVAVLGWWLDREMLETSLIQQIGGVVGQQGAEVIKAAIDSAREPGQGLFASLLAFALLLVGATGVFAELQSAFERLWTQGTGVAAADAWWHTATLRLRGVAYILAFGFLMLVSTVIASLLSLLEAWAGSRFDMKLVLAGLNQLVSFLITTGLFVALMRMSAGPQPRLRHLVRGAAAGALLFGVGKYALALYLSTAAVVSAYGAAGSLVVLLMWIYFAAAVLLFGASVARVFAEQRGEFSTAAVPPPAAAVTAVQGKARTAGAEAVAGSTAAVAAVLSEAAAAVPGDPARGVAALGAQGHATARRAVPASRRDRWLGGVALAISLGAAYLLTQRAGAAAAQRTAVPEPRAGRPARLSKPPPTSRGMAARLAGGWRALQDIARQLERDAPARSKSAGPGLSPGAPPQRLEALLVQWRRLRGRHALKQARRTLARDTEALRDALKARGRR